MCDYVIVDGDTEMVLAFTTEEDQLWRDGLSFTEMVELAEERSTQAADILIASIEDWGPPDEPVEFAEVMDRFPETLERA